MAITGKKWGAQNEYFLEKWGAQNEYFLESGERGASPILPPLIERRVHTET